MFALVLFHDARPQRQHAVSQDDLALLRQGLPRLPDLAEALIFTPASASDRHVDDGAPPPLGLQLHFPRLEQLEAACGPGGPLAALTGRLTSLDGMQATAQAFWRRTWPVAEAAPPGAPGCSYVVHYPGPAQDANAWHAAYLASHPALFQRLPGIRGIEILTPVDWVSGLPQRKVAHMQRNRVAFDSAEALTAALNSPVRDELRADFHRMPPFDGGNRHYPMQTEVLLPATPKGGGRS